MNLDFSNWKPFKLSDVFCLYNGAGITKEEIECNPGDFVAVQSGEDNNGCIGKIDKAYCIDMGYKYTEEPCLTVARTGSAGFVAYQPFGCVVGDSAKILILKDENAKSPLVYLFLRTILMANRYKYTYGRKVTEEKYLSEVVMLPAISSNLPDWGYMERYIKSLNHKPVATANRGGYRSHTLGVETWKDFCLGDYFEIKKGKRLTSDEQTEGSTPYIGAIDSNNGIANYIGQDAIHAGNTISLSYNGSVGEAFYQPKPFWATDDVNVLYFREENGVPFNKYIALFVCAVLRQEKYRYSYGRKWVLESMKSTVIKLPEKSVKPNWSYMEDYMESLPYGDRI